VLVLLCGIKALSFAIGIYLPLSTTLPIFAGGAIRGIVDWKKNRKGKKLNPEEEDLARGNLFSTGLVAGGALAGVVVAMLSVNDKVTDFLKNWSAENKLSEILGSETNYFFFAAICFLLMGATLYKIAVKEN